MTDPDQDLPALEEDEQARSRFIRGILGIDSGPVKALEDVRGPDANTSASIPRNLVRFWHDAEGVPNDVRSCMETWHELEDANFEFHTFNDVSAASYIREAYGAKEGAAFSQCAHPAMRCDYFRLCFILAEGGLYVDADDVLICSDLLSLFDDSRLKLQPLGFDIASGRMMSTDEVWRDDLDDGDRVFYVNNNPIAAPPNHPVVRRALSRATSRLLGGDPNPEIQATTGPGNLTAALVAHATTLDQQGRAYDFELLRNWPAIAEVKWDLSYRNDDRNWRNVYGY